MSGQEVFEQIRELIVAVKSTTAPVSAAEITEDSVFEQPPLAMDSLDFAHLVVSIEETFGLIAYDSDFLSLKTVRDAVQLVQDRSSRPDARGHFA
ncbi:MULTISPECIES: acyl carrier protein [Kitasatospora]|uniref:Carrier domain-containing protein n=1 Tax=Kitasatospora cystarginea TaxID=58350 RepID=A0ABN3DDI2_9ACTN